MAGIGTTLNIAKLALNAQQLAINVTGHNIANVNNEEYSRQDVPHTTTTPTRFGTFFFGTGVQVETVRRTTDQLLENRLMEQKSNQTAFAQTESYMTIMESIFTEGTGTSLSNLQSEFWSAWHEISDDPTSSAPRVSLLERGQRIVDRFDALDADLSKVETDLTREIATAVDQVNTLTKQIALLNANIINSEGLSEANDLRDSRNGMVSELAEMIDVVSFEQPSGSLSVTTANGFVIVNGVDTVDLTMKGKEVAWKGTQGQIVEISDKIEGGKIGGWLEMRDGILPKFRADLDSLAKDFIWTLNLAHSSGVGLGYFDKPVTGTYSPDESGLFSTLAYGDRIDYDKDFLMWIQDNSTADAVNTRVEMDMGISSASVGAWSGTAPGTEEARYVFTVEEGGSILSDMSVTETNGMGLGSVQRGGDYTTALDGAIGTQTMIVTGGEIGLKNILVSDAAGGADRSSRSIAAELSALTGITAYSSDVNVDIGGISRGLLDATNLLPGSASEGDKIGFSLHVGDKTEAVAFQMGTIDDATTQAAYRAALQEAVDSINAANDDSDLTLSGTGESLHLKSASGENIGIDGFAYRDNAAVNLGNFQGSAPGEVVSFELADDNAGTNGITVNFLKGADAVEDAQNLFAALTGGDTASALAAAGYTFRHDTVNDTVVIMRDGGDFAVDSIRDNGLAAASADVNIQEAGNATLDGGAVPVTITEGGNEDALAAAVNNGNRAITFQGVDVSMTPAENAAVITGTVTIEMEPDLAIASSLSGLGNSGTFGGDYTGSGNWDPGDTINFNVEFGDTILPVSVLMGGAVTTNTDVADAIATQLGMIPPVTTITLTDPAGNITITRNGNDFDYASTDNMALGFTGFDDTVGNDAVLALTANTGAVFGSNGLSGNFDLIDGGSEVIDGSGGLFLSEAYVNAGMGKSIITLGDDGGFSGLQPGDNLIFNVDGMPVAYSVGPGDTTDRDFAKGIEKELNRAGLDPAIYSIARNGASVSIMKNDGTPIDITGVRDTNASGGAPAAITVSTGTGTGTAETRITTLTANSPFDDRVSSRLFESSGIISWERFDANGLPTGASGIINVDQTDAPLTVEGTLTFDLDQGTLVAGNTFTLNTDTAGNPDPLNFTIKGQANSVLDTYKFSVKTGGKIGTDPMEIEWENEITSGSFKLEGITPPDTPFTPVFVDVDGMRIKLEDGTLRTGDLFTITTGEDGLPREVDSSGNRTGDALNNWHWTMETFTGQFNKQASGIKASITEKGTISLGASTNAHKVDRIVYSETNGVSTANASITVKDNSVLTAENEKFELRRDNSGNWRIRNNTGYLAGPAVLLPANGNDAGFGIDLDGNGISDIDIDFKVPVTGSGSISFDIDKTDPQNFSFAFAEAADGDSGVAAALGLNTFFTGESAETIGLNAVLEETKFVASGTLDDQGILSKGDNSAALAIVENQYASRNIKQWTVKRGEDITSNVIFTTHESYYNVTAGSIGVVSQSVTRAREFSDTMVTRLGEQRDSISAVSLDEEMINLIKYQQAYSAAAKLLTVTDEMLNTLINTR